VIGVVKSWAKVALEVADISLSMAAAVACRCGRATMLLNGMNFSFASSIARLTPQSAKRFS